MIRRTNRPLGGMTPRHREDAPTLSVGRDPDGEPIVVLTGGTRYRRAGGLSFGDLGNLRELRADLDTVIRGMETEDASLRRMQKRINDAARELAYFTGVPASFIPEERHG